MKVYNLFSKLIGTHGNVLFEDIVGYEHIKKRVFEWLWILTLLYTYLW
jgi:hypothetical protein